MAKKKIEIIKTKEKEQDNPDVIGAIKADDIVVDDVIKEEK